MVFALSRRLSNFLGAVNFLLKLNQQGSFFNTRLRIYHLNFQFQRSKSDKQSSQKSTQESSKILKLKKYLAVAGIRIQNYAKVFEGCKSKKAKEAKLLEMLEEQGLKGMAVLQQKQPIQHMYPLAGENNPF